MKKLFTLLLVVVITLLVGCSDSTPSTDTTAATTPSTDSTVSTDTTSSTEETQTTDATTAGDISTGASDPAQESVSSVNGYYSTTPEKLPMKIQTPKAWTYIDPTNEQKDEITDILEGGNVGQDILEQIKNNPMIYFYDKDNATKEFATNFNVIGASTGGVKQSELVGAVAEIKAMYESQFTVAPFEGFEWVMEPVGKTLGNNFFVVMISDYKLVGKAVTGCQAMTFYNGQSYTFTYSIDPSKYQDKLFADFEQVLATVEFTD